MSYPDEWEEQVERMAADLATRSVPLPESIRLMNRAVVDALAAPSTFRSIFASCLVADAVVREQRKRTWGEALWTACDLRPI
jgi:hypothetical protein